MKLAKILSASALSLCALSSVAATDFGGGKGETSLNGKPGYYEFKDGEFVWYIDGELMVKGTYMTKGKYLIVTDTEGPRACIDDEEDIEVGIYNWDSWEGKTYLTVVDDACGGRQRGFLSASPYK